MNDNDTDNTGTPQGHTPGPWEKCHDHPNPDTARSIAYIRARGSERSNEIATVYGCNGAWGGDMTPEFNARLIAAAPDMLEALWHADLILSALSGGGNVFDSCIADVRAAIAKAEGRG